jgi:hypothetical protein
MIADVEYTRFRNLDLDADVFGKLANRAEVDKNFKGGQRLAVCGINDPVPSFMPSAFSKQTTGAVGGCESRTAEP